MTTPPRQYCTFSLDGLYCGLEVQYVEEILDFQPIVAVPLAPPVVSGLINLRGQIVTALDLRRRMNMPDRLAADRPVNIVVQTSEGPLSLLVDDYGDVVDIADAALEPAPDTLPEDIRAMILGAHKLPDRLLVVLNFHTLLQCDAEEEQETALDDLSADPNAGDAQPEYDS